MANIVKVKIEKTKSERFINMDHVVSFSRSRDYCVFHLVNGETIAGEARPPTGEQDDSWPDTLVPAQPGYIALHFSANKETKQAYLTIEPVVAWHINSAAPELPAPITITDRPKADWRNVAIETPNGSVVYDDYSAESRDEWLADQIKANGAEGFEMNVFDFCGAKTSAKKSYRAPAPKAAGSDANFAVAHKAASADLASSIFEG